MHQVPCVVNAKEFFLGEALPMILFDSLGSPTAVHTFTCASPPLSEIPERFTAYLAVYSFGEVLR